MKIAVRFREDGSVGAVWHYDYYKERLKLSDEEVEAKMDEKILEANNAAGYEQFRSITVPEELEEVINLLLGERKYKGQKDIEDILDELNEVEVTISGVSRDIFDASECLETMKHKLNDILEKIGKSAK